MKLSRCTLFIDDFPEKDRVLVFNTRTLAQVVVDTKLKDILLALPASGREADKATLESLKTLQNMGIVLNGSTDETEILHSWFRELKSDTSTMKATVLTTYDCNFACTYCVEQDVIKPVYMDQDTSLKAVSYIKDRVEKDNPENLIVTFYGGEPLLNIKAIRTVAGALKQYAQSRNLPFTVGLTTNGALLTPKILDELIELGLKSTKITLDGTKEAHNKKRPFKNGKGSYDIIMRNILSAVDKIPVSVGGNFDEENTESCFALLDELKSLGLDKKLSLVGFKPIIHTPADRKALAPTADIGCVFSENSVMKSLVAFRRAVLDKGFKTEPGIGVNLCSMVMNSSSFIIDPEGKIYRCPGFVGHENFIVGDIQKPGEEDFRALDLWKRCIDCAYVPLCGDGCQYSAYVRYGDHTQLNCQKEFMEYMVRENLKLNYEYSKKEKGS